MNFKAWLNTLLNEFNITNLYDFYALELGKNQVQSYGDSLQDKEINAKIIQTGNDLLEDINDSLEIILLDRFIPPILDLYRVYGFRLGSFEDYLNHEAPEYVDKIMEYFPLYRNKEFRMSNRFKMIWVFFCYTLCMYEVFLKNPTFKGLSRMPFWTLKNLA